MSFISLSFLLFPIYFITPGKYKWILLLIASYVFYSFANIKFLFFLLISTISTYLIALILGRINDKESRLPISLKQNFLEKNLKKIILIIGLVINLGILVFVKYINFIIYNLNISNFPITNIIIPLGISFYTFQVLGYIIDVYRNEILPEKNIFKYALFVSYFPQFILGPISRFKDLSYQFFENHRFKAELFVLGIQRISFGFFKKLVIADRIDIFTDMVYANYNDYSYLILIITSILYSFQIYTDFSGYMDIAIGTSNCLGINIKENFNAPFFSKSIKEFWNRWHITLYQWFKDYVYIPLGGNRCSTLRTFFNLNVVWFLTGLWHGASWHFILWGLYNEFLIIIHIIYNKYIHLQINFINKKIVLFLQILLTFLLVSLGFILFKAQSVTDAINIIKKIFTLYCSQNIFIGLTSNLFSVIQWYILITSIIILLICDIKQIKNYLSDSKNIKLNLFITYSLLIIIFSCGKFGATTFIYFMF